MIGGTRKKQAHSKVTNDQIGPCARKSIPEREQEKKED